MKAEAVWAEAPTAEGALTWDTELRAVLLKQELARRQVLESSTSFLLPQSRAAAHQGVLRHRESVDLRWPKAFTVEIKRKKCWVGVGHTNKLCLTLHIYFFKKS